jgi:hypothetical protein
MSPTNLSASAVNASLTALQSTGATSVRLSPTWYQDGHNSTSVYPVTDSRSPLRSEGDADVITLIETLTELQIQVLLAPRLDFNWDLPSLRDRSPATLLTSAIGSAFTEAMWAEWFQSYGTYLVGQVHVVCQMYVVCREAGAFVVHYARLCGTHAACTHLLLADGLDGTYHRSREWTEIIAAARTAAGSHVKLSVST